MTPDFSSITSLQKQLETKEITATDAAEHARKVIADKNQALNAVLEVFEDVGTQAKRADTMRSQGKGTALTGIPIVLKDNILSKGKRASAASKMLENYVASYSATVTEKLTAAGAVIVGRANMDEFAMGSSTEHSAFGATKNPHDENRVPGGSSGGSAVAVASGMVPAALGSDTGGSIRQPASFCGCVGLKPTYGALSRYGLIAMGSSLDQIGPLTKTVADAELLFNFLKGNDTKDSTSLADALYTDVAVRSMKKTIGVPRSFLTEGVDAKVLELFEQNLTAFKEQGYTIVDITLPHVHHALPAYYILMPAEASTNLARYDGMRYGLHEEGASLLDEYAASRSRGFGREVRRRILLGTYVLSAGYYDSYYGTAKNVRNQIRADFDRAFETVDVIATPTAPTPAFTIGEKTDPVSMYLADIFTVPANITGMPGISIPGGVVEVGGKKLPVGIQLLAPPMHEQFLFEAGKALESALS